MSIDRDVAVVGMACIFPKAANVQQFWWNLANGVDAIDAPPPGRWTESANFTLPDDHEAFVPSNRGGFLPTELAFDPVPFGVQPNLVRHGDPDQFLMLHVIDAALHDANVVEDSPLRKRTDVIIGRGGYSTGKMAEMSLRAEMCEVMLELLDRRYPHLIGPQRREMEEYVRSTLTPPDIENVSTGIANISASRAANRLNLRGAAYTVDGACASSLLAIEQAVGRLRSGQCDLAVAAGVFLSLSPTFLSAFTRLGALSPSGAMRPFDRRADGLLAGEGGGAVILKRLDHALRDGNTIYALVKGVGSASDGREVDVLAPSSQGQVQALENAYADAGIDRASVGYLELHGTGTVVGDLTELETVKSFFGRVDEPATARAMGTVKSMIGHCMPASGIAAFIKCALALSNKILPPSLHCEEPRPELADAPFYLITQTRPWVHNPTLGPRRAAVNAFGFGGINAHVILEEAPASTARPIECGLRRPSELLAFAAESEADLREQLRRLERFLDRDESNVTLADLAFTLSQNVEMRQPVKLALVCDDRAHVRRLLARCLAVGPTVAAAEAAEIYYATDAAQHRGKIAFLFPGMGFPGLIGNYPDHLLDLCMHYPDVRAEFDFFEDRDRHPEDTIPTSAIFSPPPTLPEAFRQRLKARLAPPKAEDYNGETQPRERFLAAMGVTLSNWVSWTLLRKFDIPVDMLTGQSQGEMAALCAAGVADFHAIAPGFWKVLNIDARAAVGHQLAFAWANESVIAPLLADEPEAHLAIHMSPLGVILGGRRDSLLRISDKLQAQGILSQLLPYPPIHTPCLSHLRAELVKQFADEKVELRKPNVAFYSSITSEPYPNDPVGIRETLLMNVDRPLRVWQTIRRLYDDGARLFVQVGGGHVAAHLDVMLPEGADALAIAVDVDVRHPLTQLNHLCATLFRAGVPMRLDPLFAHRTVRTLDLDCPQPAPKPSRFAVPLRMDWSPLKHENAARGTNAPRPQGGRVGVGSEATETAAPPPQPSLIRGEGEKQFFPARGEGEAFGGLKLPVLGQITHFVTEQELVIERTLDLAEDLFLHDHLFVHAECKPMEERLPILPLTMSMEFAAECAALLSPGLGLIGFENVRGRRWIGLRDRADAALRIEAQVESTDADTGVRRVRCTIYFEEQPSFTATVLFAEAYRSELVEPIADSSADAPWPIRVEQVYGDRMAFHGPRFWSIRALHTLGNPGASGALAAMPHDRLFASDPEPLLLTDPCLLDGMGQFVGLWACMHEQYVLPIGVEKIEFYAPPPPAGTICPLRMEVVSFDPQSRQMRFNVELEDGAGAVRARIRGWTDWLLNWATNYVNATSRPRLHVLAEELELPELPKDSVVMLATRDSFAGADWDWAARHFLHSSEMPLFAVASDKEKRRQLVAGRAAVKDAVRLWWARKLGTDMQHPAEFALADDTRGGLHVLSDDAPRVALARTANGIVAIAADCPVGIALYESDCDEDETRLHCAKEAAAQALACENTRELEALDGDDEGAFLIQHKPSGERLIVRTARLETFVLAWTTRQDAPTPTGPHSENKGFPVMMRTAP